MGMIGRRAGVVAAAEPAGAADADHLGRAGAGPGLAAVLLVSALHASLVRDLDVVGPAGRGGGGGALTRASCPAGAGRAPGTLTIQVLDATGPDHQHLAGRGPAGADAAADGQARAAARTGQPGRWQAAAGLPTAAAGGGRRRGRTSAIVISAISYAQASDSLATLTGVLADRDAAVVRPAGPGHLAAHRVHAAADRRAAPGRRRGDRGPGVTA